MKHRAAFWFYALVVDWMLICGRGRGGVYSFPKRLVFNLGPV